MIPDIGIVNDFVADIIPAPDSKVQEANACAEIQYKKNEHIKSKAPFIFI